MKTIILKNKTTSALTINSVGLTINSNDSTNINPVELNYYSDNDELYTLIAAGSIVVNDGTSDLSSTDAKVFLQPGAANTFSTSSHTHTKSQITDFSHSHDDLYNTKSEITTYLSNKSDTTHTHSSLYAPISHMHTKSQISDFVESNYVHVSGTETIAGDKTFTGSITISGTLTTINSQTINLADNSILLNSDYSGSSPTENAGLEINRGTLTHASLIWDETNDIWKLGLLGSEKAISTTDHNHDSSYYSQSQVDTKLALYYTKALLDAGQLDNRYFTESEITTNYYTKTDLATYASTYYYSKTQLDGGQLDNRYYTKTLLDGGQLDNRYFTEAEITTTLGSYYTKTDIDTKLSKINYAFVTANDSNTNVTSAELETLTNGSNADALHTHSNSGSGSATLDSAYGTYGGGRTVTVDNGPIELKATSGFAPLRLEALSYTPSQWLSGGEIFFRNNEMWFRDSLRSLMVSFAAYSGVFSSNANSAFGYLYYGQTQNNSNTGMSAPWDGVITGISITCQNYANDTIDICNGGTTSQSVYITGYSYVNTDLNISFSAGDAIQIYIENGYTRPSKPCATLYYRRRIS